MEKILLIGAWFFGVIFIIASLGAFLEGSIVAGLLMLIGAVLLLPPIKRLILSKKTKLSSGKITAVGSILVLISFFLATLGDDTNDMPPANSSVETKQEAVEPQLSTEAVKEKEPVEVAATPVENKPIVEPEPAIEKTKIDKPINVEKTAPSEPSIAEKSQDIDLVKIRAILDKADQEVKEAKGFNFEDGAAVAKKSRRMIALNEEMTALTKEMPSIGSENGKIGFFCGLTVGEGAGYWRHVMSLTINPNKDPQTSKRLLNNYQESRESCLDNIKDFENS